MSRNIDRRTRQVNVVVDRRAACRPRRADTPSTPYAVRLTAAERERLARAAAVNHQTPADFARDALITAAEDCLEGLS